MKKIVLFAVLLFIVTFSYTKVEASNIYRPEKPYKEVTIVSPITADDVKINSDEITTKVVIKAPEPIPANNPFSYYEKEIKSLKFLLSCFALLAFLAIITLIWIFYDYRNYIKFREKN